MSQLKDGIFNNVGSTLGNVIVQPADAAAYGQFPYGQFHQQMAGLCQYNQNLALYQEQKRMSGHKPIVVCGGETREAKDMDDAQQIAESLAHSKSADAYILKPVKKVSPKRDVVTTDL